MSWPTPQDYLEAIQNPQLCFEDPELKAGKPQEDRLGLPRPITGGFASVYRIRCAQRDWAVRCFLREFDDQKERYGALSEHLATVKLPYIVEFKFLAKGIKVKNCWYPILKMEWVQGELLNEYIKKHLRDSATLLKLAEKWQTMIKNLEGANVGHGDLQHGNIIIVNGDIRLIDYDGMFVPALAGQKSHEVGHRNYQHPLRSEFDFGPYIDNFAAWVIYISLVALSIEPNLWIKVGADEEHILFRKEDFIEPDSSSTLKLLTNHLDDRIQSLASLFQSMLYLGYQQIPALDNQSSNQLTSNPLPDWLTDHVKLGQPSPTKTLSAPYQNINLPFPSLNNSTWVVDFISKPETNKTFNSSVATPRIITFISIACLVVLSLVFYFLFVPLVSVLVIFSLLVITGLVNELVFHYYYHKDPVIVEREVLLVQEKQEKHLSNFLQRSVKDLYDKKKNLLTKRDKEKKALDKQSSELKRKEQDEATRIQKQLEETIKSIGKRRLNLNSEEARELGKLQEALRSLLTQLTSLARTELSEIENRLELEQKAFLADYLAAHRIIDASIPGVGDILKTRLLASRIKTAADIEYTRIISVNGIGENKSNALIDWREKLIHQANREMPNSLPQRELDTIKQKYIWQKQQLETNKRNMQQQILEKENTIRSEYMSRRQALNNEQLDAQAKTEQELQLITNRYVQASASLSQKMNQLDLEVKDELQKIDGDIIKLQQQLSGSHWSLAKIRHKLKTFENISFPNYLRFIFWGAKTD